MIHPALYQASQAVSEWCHQHAVPYDLGCDEPNMQGILILKKDRGIIRKLLEDVGGSINDQVCVQLRKVRHGTIVSLSLHALTEDELTDMAIELGQIIEPMTLADKLSEALAEDHEDIRLIPISEPGESLLQSAERIVGEQQYKSPTTVLCRENPTNAYQGSIGDNCAARGCRRRTRRRKKSLDERIAEAAGQYQGMSGIATSTGVQPNELFTRFRQALDQLGQQHGIASLWRYLQEHGIQIKQKDAGTIILAVTNAESGQLQPILMVSHDDLDEPHEFEKQLVNVMDIARGEAPGALEQRLEKLQSINKSAREVANNAVGNLGSENRPAQTAVAGHNKAQPVAPNPQGFNLQPNMA